MFMYSKIKNPRRGCISIENNKTNTQFSTSLGVAFQIKCIAIDIKALRAMFMYSKLKNPRRGCMSIKN